MQDTLEKSVEVLILLLINLNYAWRKTRYGIFKYLGNFLIKFVCYITV